MVTRQWMLAAAGRGVAVGCCVSMLAVPLARASGPDDSALDAATIVQLEQRADHAQPREQCYWYSRLLQALTETAGREMSAGQDAPLATTLAQIDTVMAKIQKISARDAKKLKDAEKMMERTEWRLTDMARVASHDEQAGLKSTLERLNQLHSKVLALVFTQ
ncbi:MAG: hypothetical protein V4555_17155 [Acidobacteriota bacterium]